jgi:hypothetical protein
MAMQPGMESAQGQEQPAAPQEGQAGGGSMEQFISNLGNGLSTLAEMVAATEGASPEAGQLIDGMMSNFDQLLQVMSGGGGQAAPQNGKPNPVPVESGKQLI